MVKVIKTDAEYEAAMAEVSRLIDLSPDSGTDESNRLEVLALLIENYENQEAPIDLPDSVGWKPPDD